MNTDTEKVIEFMKNLIVLVVLVPDLSSSCIGWSDVFLFLVIWNAQDFHV